MTSVEIDLQNWSCCKTRKHPAVLISCFQQIRFEWRKEHGWGRWLFLFHSKKRKTLKNWTAGCFPIQWIPKWTKRFRYSFSAWNFVFPVAVGHRFRFRKYSLFLKSVNWHSYRKLFSNAKQTAEVHHGDLNWNRFTELILLQNSKTSCRSSFLFSTNTIWVAKRARLGPVTLKTFCFVLSS